MSEEKIEHLADPAQEPQVLPKWRGRRLVEIVGSFYTLALLVAAGALWLFGELADEVMAEEFAELNRSILLWIHSFANPTFESMAHTLSWIGSVYGVVIIVGFTLAQWLKRKRFIDAGALLMTVIGSVSLTIVLKQVFRQIRPQVFPPLAIERSFSFPSGHTLTSFCLWGFLACWIVIQNPKEPWRWFVAILCLGFAAMVAASRMYLGVHWPTDVTAGILIATFWVAVCVTGQRWLLDRRNRRAKA
jgi:undecaprenyl-diphosphatase